MSGYCPPRGSSMPEAMFLPEHSFTEIVRDTGRAQSMGARFTPDSSQMLYLTQYKFSREVLLAISNLSAKRHGAIIVIEQKINLDEHLQGGVVIDATIGAPILENIFYPGSPLHDGAVIIRNDHIQKASCLLPLAPHTSELDSLGLATRHRAAIGLSQVSDALIIIVSEDKGWISIALQGQLYPNLGTFALLEKLEDSMEDGNRFSGHLEKPQVNRRGIEGVHEKESKKV